MDDNFSVGSFVLQKIEQLDMDTSNSRGLSAKLRKAVGKPPGASPDIWEVTMQGTPEAWHGSNGKPSIFETAIHTALTLYALHRQGFPDSMQKKGVSIASATAEIILRDYSRKDAIIRRFNTIATANSFNELCHHARGIIQLLKANSIGMDYTRFVLDLLDFQHSGGADRIRLRWGEDFYRVLDKYDGEDEKK